MEVEVVPILRVRETVGVTFGLISIDLTDDRLILELTSRGEAPLDSIPDDVPTAFGLHIAPWRIVDATTGDDLRLSSGAAAGTSGRRRLRWSFHLTRRPTEVRAISPDGRIVEDVSLEPLPPIEDSSTYSVSDDVSSDVAPTLADIRTDAIPNSIDALRGSEIPVRDRTAWPIAVERWTHHDVVRFLSLEGPVDMRPMWRFDRITADGVQSGVPVGAGSSGREAWTRIAFVRD